MISADVFFEALFNGGFVEPFQWKNTAPGTSFYTVFVNCKKCTPKSLHVVKIEVRNGVHYVYETSLQFFASRHNIKLQGIL